MVRDLIICVSLANLCFLDSWNDLQKLARASYFLKTPADATLLIATIGSVLLVAAGFWIALLVARSVGHPMGMRLARAGFLLCAGVPLTLTLRTIPFYSWLAPWFTGALTAGVILIAALPLFGMGRAVIRVQTQLILALAPLFVISLLYLTINFRKLASPYSYVDAPRRHALSKRRQQGFRVVWFVFDEFDECLVFRNRPAQIALPELDRLRAQALYATDARSPATMTTISMPALITGKLLFDAQATRTNELLLTFQGSEKKAGWSTLPNVFSAAGAAGFNSGLVGWHHPYCRVIGNDVSKCYWEPNLDASTFLRSQAYSSQVGILQTIRLQILQHIEDLALFRRLHLHWGDATAEEYKLTRRQHSVSYFATLKAAASMITDPDLDLILLHLPVPHPEGIYNRYKAAFTLDESNDYLDNLEVADMTVGKLRHLLETSGLDDRTALLVTSDHPFRKNIWSLRPTWTAEERATLGGKACPSVPFMLKLPGQSASAAYHREFNTVITAQLLLDVLRGDLHSSNDVMAWLDAHAR